jgi:hypothetical protein
MLNKAHWRLGDLKPIRNLSSGINIRVSSALYITSLRYFILNYVALVLGVIAPAREKEL